MENYNVKICDKTVSIKKTPKAAIKAYCTDCSVGSQAEIKDCPCTECPLYPFRGFMKFEGKKREMTEDQKQAARERMATMRNLQKL